MRSFVLAIVCVLVALASTANAFAPPKPAAASFSRATTVPTTTELNVFGNKKASAAAKAEEAAKAEKYWAGEWVCKDCGYIYNRVSTTVGNDETLYSSVSSSNL